ncbi:MAG: DNRLRE domain-containing protein [Candidatus Aegiribacteria sp.]|nr:DNRLRE domain-containing protein [Candidatus Aegiribacteria sp.]MBD3294196.1 DNRLRE domain-containing protein [Candidatus Fermentibacteria bacterium]
MKLFIFIALCLVSTVLSDVAVMQPGPAEGKDSEANELFPDSNYGLYSNIKCGFQAGYWAWTYVEFEELNEAQYQGANVLSAYLSLYVITSNGTGQYLIGTPDGPWDESTITWNNKPDPSGTVTILADYPEFSGWVNYDVTELVQAWLNGTVPHHGFLLHDFSTSTNRYFHFYSSDYQTSPDFRPELILSYDPQGSLDTSTWGRIKNVF